MWSAGLYFDARDAAYDDIALHGDPITSALTPRIIRSGQLTPAGSPTWHVGVIGGRRAINFVAASTQRFDAHQLGALQNGSDLPTTVIERRQLNDIGTLITWGFGTSGQAADGILEASTFSTNGSIGTRKDAIGEVIVSQTGGVTSFAPIVVARVITGTEVLHYIETAGVMTLVAGFPKALDTLPLACDRFCIGSTARSTPTAYTSMDLQCLAITGQALTQAQLQTVRDAWVADDAPASAGTRIAWYGDSITKGSQDSGEGGFRRYVYNNCVTNAKAVDFQGTLSSGTFPENQHSGYSSFEILQVNNRITAELGVIEELSPQYTVLMAGTNDLNNGGSPVAQALTDITTTINNLHAKGTQIDAAHRIVLASVIDQQGFTSNVDDFNAGLPAIIATFNAANPSNQIIFWDAHAAIGAWSSTNYADTAHPNSTGYALLGNSLYTVLAPFIP